MPDICDLMRGRWSPRQFDTSYVADEATVNLLLEAARWAPSAQNLQRWRFIAGLRGTDTFERLGQAAVRGNSEWALSASVLVTNIADGADAPYVAYDLGGAVQHMVLQGEALGLHARVFAMFDADLVRTQFKLDAGLTPITMTAFGVAAPDAVHPDRQRRALEQNRLR